jgi:hypothetical protein
LTKSIIKIGDIVQFNHWTKNKILFTHTGFIAKKSDKSAFDWIAVSFLTEEEVYLDEEWIKTCMCNDI